MLLKLFIIFVSVIFFLNGCAVSRPSRTVSGDINSTVSAMNRESMNTSPTSVWNNASQMQKGLIIGGVTGGLAGGVSGVGWLPGVTTGAIFGGAMGAWIDSETTVADQLQNRGAKIFILGDHIRIILPTSNLFDRNGFIFTDSAAPTLDLVVMFISHYPNQAVAVVAYADPHIWNSQTLTHEQARAVMKYLWRMGINTRLLYAVGADGVRPVVGGGSWLLDDNNRIEINLEKLPV